MLSEPKPATHLVADQADKNKLTMAKPHVGGAMPQIINASQSDILTKGDRHVINETYSKKN